MDEAIIDTIGKYCNPALLQIVFSNSRSPEELKKVLVRPVRLKGGLFFQACEFRGKQVFHENYTKEELLKKLPDWLPGRFRQAELFAQTGQAVILVSKKGRITIREKQATPGARGAEQDKNKEQAAPEACGAEQNKNKEQAASEARGAEQDKNKEQAAPEARVTGQDKNKEREVSESRSILREGKQPAVPAWENIPAEHNRRKNYILEEGKPVPFLVALGVMTPEGRVVHAKYDKFRQINRFLEFIEDILPQLPQGRELTILDFGCGKSYLTFAMYYYLHELKQYPLRVTGLDLKTDVIERCSALAERCGYDGLTFLQGDIASYEGMDAVDMVVTLHACDTATDAALKKAVDWNARVILSVPCCQHELNRTIKNEMLEPVLRYGLLKERMAALITDGLRADLLEQLGYKVQVLEFIDMEHTPKNILLRAVKRDTLLPASVKKAKREAYERCIRELHVNPALYRGIIEGQEG